VIHVRREICRGKELTPKTVNGEREIDIDPMLADLLRQYIATIKGPRIFSARNGSPIRDNNVRKRVLTPLLARLGIPKGGLHAFRHSRVTILRKKGTPADLQKQWIGHSSLRTTDRYSHTDQELEYRRQAASRAGIESIVGPNGPKPKTEAAERDAVLTATA
jgi:integrase